MRKKLLLGLTLTTGLTTPAMAEKWFEAGTTDEVIAFIDADSIKANGSLVTMTVFQGFELGKGEKIDIFYTKSHMELDCSGKKLRDLRADVFGTDYAMLPPVAIDSAWRPIVDGTLGASYSDFACDGEQPTDFIANPFTAADEYWEYMYYYGE